MRKVILKVKGQGPCSEIRKMDQPKETPSQPSAENGCYLAQEIT